MADSAQWTCRIFSLSASERRRFRHRFVSFLQRIAVLAAIVVAVPIQFSLISLSAALIAGLASDLLMISPSTEATSKCDGS